ncbi:GerAB/ArcD/ProY family transporter [Ureibacillus chungkukjangi]|uniref:Spore germination protein (Amino acid permease) n=1 Tax=Ureibacillus chungkukjangi TaxID=1202712 RepID=A0A318TLH6_9BACL|nr:GerAB/ArcD/ProY family transporter [Ureibacillus chungkukjangi]MCM3387843.1 spore germination protein [Ureibacillus chungkukjangi]PYF05681.1 spore germination protein (amino acid permease) [Ureibacillus chungkukjangi]
MKSLLQISNDQKFNAPLLFFVVVTSQIAVGIQGFQRLIVKDATHDAWISILLSFLFSHFIVYVMFKTLEIYSTNDLFGIQLDLFGKYLGHLINFSYVIYVSFAFFVVLKNYTEIITTWVFPNLSQVFISGTLLILVIYSFTGGLRVIIGVCFISVVSTIWMLLLLLFPLEYAHYNHLLPVLSNDLVSILKGAYSMTFTIVGFEVVNILYPFVKDKNKAQKYVHFGLFFTCFVYVFVMIVTIVYFSNEQLEKTIWALLTLFSIIKLPFIERIEIIVICFWLIIILPNLCLFSWSAYRGIVRIKNIKGTTFIWIFTILIFFVSLPVQSRHDINRINNIFSKIAFYVVFIYPLFLYIMASTKKILKKWVKSS